MTLDPSVTAECRNGLEFESLPADTYALEVTGQDASGLKWGTGAYPETLCGGLSYDGRRMEFYCSVEIQMDGI